MEFILSKDRPTYAGESCDDWSGLRPAYTVLSNVNPGVGPGKDIKITEPINLSDSYFTDWQYVEFKIGLTNQNLNWFSINVDGVGKMDLDDYAAYFAFDDFYISDAICYCPIFRLIQNQTLLSPTLTKAQEYIRAGYDVGYMDFVPNSRGNVIIQTGTGKSIFRAGNYITLEPGFEVKLGAVFETQIQGCNNPDGQITATMPNSYTPNCDGINDKFCFYPNGATSYSFDLYDRWYQLVATLSGQIPEGATEVCLDLPLETTGDNVYIYFMHLGNCGDGAFDKFGSIAVLDATAGCFPSMKTNVNSASTLSLEPYPDGYHGGKQKELQVFPDPACDNITLKISGFDVTDKITIRTIEGKKVYETVCQSDQTAIPVVDLSDGLYIITYTSYDGTNSSKKFTKICSK